MLELNVMHLFIEDEISIQFELVAFRIFDFNEDGKIDVSDL